MGNRNNSRNNNRGRRPDPVKTRQQHVTVQYDEPVSAETSAPSSREDLALLGWLGSFGLEASKIKIFKRDLATNRFKFVGDATVSDLDETIIGRRFGNGEFQVRAISTDGHTWLGSRNVDIELPDLDSGLILPAAMPDSSDKIRALEIQLETQRVELEKERTRAETDRREREQRNHEITLKLLESRGVVGGNGGVMSSALALPSHS